MNNMDNLTLDNLIFFLQSNGPSTLMEIASNFKVQSYFAGAIISEGIRSKKIFTTNKTMGSSSIHYLESQKEQIFDIIIDKINEKDRINILLLKEKKILFRDEISEFQDFSLTQIKDLAKYIEIPINGQNVKIWYYYTLNENELKNEILKRYEKINNKNTNKNTNHDNKTNQNNKTENINNKSQQNDIKTNNNSIFDSLNNELSQKKNTEKKTNNLDEDNKKRNNETDTSIFDNFIKNSEKNENKTEEINFDKFSTKNNLEYFLNLINEKKCSKFIQNSFNSISQEFEIENIKINNKKIISINCSYKIPFGDLSFLIKIIDAKRLNENEIYKTLYKSQKKNLVTLIITNAQKLKNELKENNLFIIYNK